MRVARTVFSLVLFFSSALAVQSRGLASGIDPAYEEKFKVIAARVPGTMPTAEQQRLEAEVKDPSSPAYVPGFHVPTEIAVMKAFEPRCLSSKSSGPLRVCNSGDSDYIEYWDGKNTLGQIQTYLPKAGDRSQSVFVDKVQTSSTTRLRFVALAEAKRGSITSISSRHRSGRSSASSRTGSFSRCRWSLS